MRLTRGRSCAPDCAKKTNRNAMHGLAGWMRLAGLGPGSAGLGSFAIEAAPARKLAVRPAYAAPLARRSALTLDRMWLDGVLHLTLGCTA